MSFLEKGKRPDLGTNKSIPWPLPILQLPVRDRVSRWTHFPDTGTLIDIAIKEKRHDDILKWYRLGRKSSNFGRDYTGEKAAQAIQMTHPDEALSIWKALAAQEISHAKPAAYQTAGHYLKKIKKVYSQTKNEAAGTQYMDELREHNKRRPRMLDVLNSLEGRRTRNWPSLVTIVLWPVLVGAYVWLAVHEERQALKEYGRSYAAYAARTKRFIPFMI